VNAHEKAYQTFILDNPKAWLTFVFYATRAVAKNRPTSVKAIVERVRWDARMKWRRDPKGFKFNNNYTAYLGRDLAAFVPGLGGLLETRKVAA
jgi:hypothetical protein